MKEKLCYNLSSAAATLDISPKFLRRLIRRKLIKAFDMNKGKGKYEKLHITHKELMRFTHEGEQDLKPASRPLELRRVD